MLKKRDWLIKQGLVKPGARGRLSKQANDAVDKALREGMQFSDVALDSTEHITTAKPLPEQTVQHKQDAVWGIDRAGEPIVIAFCHCAACGKSIRYCTHTTPVLPKWIDSPTYMEKPKLSN